MAEEPSKKPSRRAERIGKYEILERIACGGMGIVYKARDPDLERLVALKILPPDMAKQETTLIRFQREGKAAAKLRHENIVSIYEISEFNGAHYIAMEYVDGKDLQDYIGRQCRLDPTEARSLMIQAAKALVHAHEHGIVHRDIKPSNFLLITKTGTTILKLTDFGLAIRNENEDEFRITKDKTTVGTVDYMSPEQARDSRSADIRSDIYSLGCTFYHMLSGTAPFARGTLTERIVQHMRTPVPDVRKLNESVPKALGAIIHRMLAKKPADRYQTPADLLLDLENLQRVDVPNKSAAVAKRGRTISRRSRADVTSVIENKDLDEASAAPPQSKLTRAKRTPPPDEEDDPPSVDDLEIEEPEAEEEAEAADAASEGGAEAKAERARLKNPAAASSPLWMYAAAGTVALMGLILVLAFASGSRQPLPKKEKEPEKKVVAPPSVAVGPKKETTPPEPVEPPPTVVRIDTAPEKMTVVAPPLPIMDFDPAKADPAALRKDFAGPFDAFPTVPEQANRARLRRLNVAGSASYSDLADALAQTKAEQFNVIEIADDGPIFASALPAISKRTILLRGADGYRPLLVWDLPKKPADVKRASFLTVTGGRLILENLDFVVNAPANAPIAIFDLPESDFFAQACTFSIGGKSPKGIPLIRRANLKPPGVEPIKTQTWLRCCYLRGPDALFLQHHESPAEVLIDDSLLVGYRHPLLSVHAKDEDFLAFHCIRSTLVTGQVLLRWQASNGKRVNPYFQGCVLDSILTRDDPTAPQGDMVQLQDAGDTNRMQWRAKNSVYAGWKQLLGTRAKDIPGHDLDIWHRHWAYSLSDRVVGEAWPSSPPSGLEELSARTFYPTNTLLSYGALTGSGSVGCAIGRLPAAPENWRERTLESRPTPIFANIEAGAPNIDSAADGKYHGERLDLNKIDLGAYLTATLQKMPAAPRVVMHLTGKGVCNTSPLRVNGVRHLVLYFEPAKDPLILEVNPTSFAQRGPLIEMTGGHLEMIGARIRLSLVTFVPTLIHVQDGQLTLSRCWLSGPLTNTAKSFQSLVTVANTSPTPALLLLRENVLVSSKLLIHAKENVQFKARNNVFVSLGDGLRFEVAAPIDGMQHVSDHNTWAVRETCMQLRAGPDSLPKASVLMLASSNAFLRPFDGTADRAALTRGFEAWSAADRWRWQGRDNVYDARMPTFHLPDASNAGGGKQTLKDWQRLWGQVGEQENQVLTSGMATRELSLDGLTAGAAFWQLDRLQLPRQIRADVTQGRPGADLSSLGILKKKG